MYGVFILKMNNPHFSYGETGRRGPWSCLSQSYFLCNELYTGVRVDFSYRLRKIFIGFMGAKSACLNVDLGNEDEDTHL